MNLEVAYIIFASADTESKNKLIDICTQNADKWATDGWGGYISPGAKSSQLSGLILMTPKLNHADAVASMKPLTDFAASLPNVPKENGVYSETSFYQAYEKYISPNQEQVGLGIAIGSRLIPRGLMQSTSGQQTVAAAIKKAADMVIPLSSGQTDVLALTYGAPLQILVTTPSSFETDGSSSVTPTWYGSNGAIWHVALGQAFANNADVATIQSAFRTANQAAQVLRDATPGSGAYQNEADVFEPEPEEAYWGRENYDRLLTIKKKIDPKNVLTCWGCIGWDKSDARYSCYPSI
jgi:hypothetical protein